VLFKKSPAGNMQLSKFEPSRQSLFLPDLENISSNLPIGGFTVFAQLTEGGDSGGPGLVKLKGKGLYAVVNVTSSGNRSKSLGSGLSTSIYPSHSWLKKTMPDLQAAEESDIDFDWYHAATHSPELPLKVVKFEKVKGRKYNHLAEKESGIIYFYSKIEGVFKVEDTKYFKSIEVEKIIEEDHFIYKAKFDLKDYFGYSSSSDKNSVALRRIPIALHSESLGVFETTWYLPLKVPYR